MGCGGTRTKASSPQSLPKLIEKVNELIKSNPFYNSKETIIRSIINDSSNPELLLCKTYKTAADLENAKRKLLNSKISLLCKGLKMNSIHTSIITDILSYSTDKFTNIFDSSSSVSFYYNDLIITLFYFLCETTPENESKKNNFISHLIQLAKVKQKGNRYYSGKLSFLIYQFIQFSCFSFIYLFASVGVLTIFAGANESDLISLFVNKRDGGGLRTIEINDFIMERLVMMNLKVHPEYIVRKLLSNTLQPLSRIIVKNPNAESVLITQKQLKSIIQNILDFFNIQKFSNFFFNNRIEM